MVVSDIEERDIFRQIRATRRDRPQRPPREEVRGTGGTKPSDIPTVPSDPNSQTAIVDGEEVYIEGSTMREVYGFETPEQYIHAQKYELGKKDNAYYGPLKISDDIVKNFAVEHGLSESAARETLKRAWYDPKSDEFRALSESQQVSLQAAISGGTPYDVSPTAIAEGETIVVKDEQGRTLMTRLAPTPQEQARKYEAYRGAMATLSDKGFIDETGSIKSQAFAVVGTDKEVKRALFDVGLKRSEIQRAVDAEKKRQAELADYEKAVNLSGEYPYEPPDTSSIFGGEAVYYVRGILSDSDKTSFAFAKPLQGELIKVNKDVYNQYEQWLAKIEQQDTARQYLIERDLGELKEGMFTSDINKARQAGVPEDVLKTAGFSEISIQLSKVGTGEIKEYPQGGKPYSEYEEEDIELSKIELTAPPEETRGMGDKYESIVRYYNEKSAPNLTGLKLTGSEISSLERALRQLDIEPLDGGYIERWRQLDNDTKLQVAEIIANDPYSDDVTRGMALSLRQVSEPYLVGRRGAMAMWASTETELPEEVTIDYLNKVASYDFFKNGGSTKERVALVNAMRNAGIQPGVAIFRELSDADKQRVVDNYKLGGGVSKEIEEYIDKPVSDFFSDLESKALNVDNDILRALATYGTGGLTAIGGGTTTIGTSIIKSIADTAEGYHKAGVAQIANVPIGMAEWATVHTPQTYVRDPISGVSMTLGAITAPFALGKVGKLGESAYKLGREAIFPAKFEPSSFSMEVAIPRTQLRGYMTTKGAAEVLREAELLKGGKITNEVVLSEYNRLLDAGNPEAAFSMLYQYAVSNSVIGKSIKSPLEGGGLQGEIRVRSTPAGLGLSKEGLSPIFPENVLYSVKPDIYTYVNRIGETGSDIAPTGTMEWWSPNLSMDVMGWYLGKVDKYAPGGKMLRYTADDIKQIPAEVYESVARKMKDPVAWKEALEKSKRDTRTGWDDTPTAYNILLRDEMYRRAQLPSSHPEALPNGIYPVFKFHWSYEPSGKFRPTWEYEYITPAGFESIGLKPTTWSSSLKTGGEVMPKVATLDTYSPLQGMDKFTGQRINLGEKIPVVITATKSAIEQGKGVPTVADMYRIKFWYKPQVALVNLFSRGKEIRPRATAMDVSSTPRKWYSRIIKFEELKDSPTDIKARNIIENLSDSEKLSTIELAEKLGETVENGKIVGIREPYYHPVMEYGTNWVAPRVATLAKHPTIKDAYIVFNDTAELPNVWSMGGGQIDPRGTPIISGRKFGEITLEQSLREQFISEIGVDLKNIKPAKIHEGKTTEHSQYGTYMFDSTLASTKFEITPGEVRAIRILRSGDSAVVTPALYIELAKRGFDVSNLVIYDKNLPTAGMKQYSPFSEEANILSKAKVIKNPNKIPELQKSKYVIIDETVPKSPKIEITAEELNRIVDEPYDYILPYRVTSEYKYPVFNIKETIATELPVKEIAPSEAISSMAESISPISSEVIATMGETIEPYEAPMEYTELLTEPPTEPIEPPTEPTEPPTEPVVPIEPPVRPPFIIARDKRGEEREVEIRPGTISWIQGRPTGGAMYKIVVPPYDQDSFFTTRDIPPGYIDEGWEGEGMVQQSLQVIGGTPPNNIRDLDLGIARVNINIEGGKPEIEFLADRDANIGVRSKTVGMGRGQIPIEEWDKAKIEGIDYNTFVREYKGRLVGDRVNGIRVASDKQIAIASLYDLEDELTPSREWYNQPDSGQYATMNKKKKLVKLDRAEQYYRGHPVLPAELGGLI